MPAAEDALPSRPAQSRAWRTSNVVHALDGELNLILAKVEYSTVLGKVGNEENTRNADWHADDAVHDEQPLPTGKAVQAVHSPVHASLEIPTEHRSGGGGGVEDAGSLCQLGRLVPGAKTVKHGQNAFSRQWKHVPTSYAQQGRRSTLAGRRRSG